MSQSLFQMRVKRKRKLQKVHLLQSQKEELEQAKAKAKAKVASLKAKTSYPDINQLTELLVDELKNIKWELPTEFLKFPSQVSLVQEKLKILDSLPSLLNKVTDTLTRFSTMVENASGATSMNVPSAGKATVSPTKGEKNTKDADTNLKDELVDLLGKNVVTQLYTRKLLFDKYCDKMLKRKKSSKITKCEALTKKGPITLKIYREDGPDEVISNLKSQENKFEGDNTTIVIQLPYYSVIKGPTKEEVERKLKETLGLLAQEKLQSDETLKTQAYDLLRKEKEQLKKDFKISQDKDIEKLIALENQVKFSNDIVYKTNQYVQTIHMLAPNSSSSYNGRPGFKNPKYLKKAQSEKLYLYKVSYDKDDLANIFAPNYEETLILVQESRSKLDKEKIKKWHNYLEAIAKCECLENELSKRNENIDNKLFNELTRKFAELVRHFISLELSLKQRNEVLQYNRPCQNKDAPGFPEFFEINELKAQIQDKKTVINELKKLIEKLKGKSVDTKFEKPSFVRQSNAFRFKKTISLR
ncbi:hypothetical protein Tco_0672352 [Tanacetum coccineum]